MTTNNTNPRRPGGIDIIGLCTLVFVHAFLFKLFGIIDCSWWMVFSPLLILVITISATLMVCWLVCRFLGPRKER